MSSLQFKIGQFERCPILEFLTDDLQGFCFHKKGMLHYFAVTIKITQQAFCYRANNRSFMSPLGRDGVHLRVAEVVILYKFLWRLWTRFTRSHRRKLRNLWKLCLKFLMPNCQTILNITGLLVCVATFLNFKFSDYSRPRGPFLETPGNYRAG